MQAGAIFVTGKKCVKISFNLNIAVLQSFPGLHVIFYRLKKTSLFSLVQIPAKICHYRVEMFVSEKENTDVKIIIPSSIANHIAIAVLLQIIAIRYFLKIVQP